METIRIEREAPVARIVMCRPEIRNAFNDTMTGHDGGDTIIGDVLVHVMQAETRKFYDLERLWQDLPTTDTESKV